MTRPGRRSTTSARPGLSPIQYQAWIVEAEPFRERYGREGGRLGERLQSPSRFELVIAALSRCSDGLLPVIVATMATKLTIVVDNPNDPAAFEAHLNSSGYREPIGKIPDVQRIESAKVFPKEDGSPTPAYRTIDIYFPDYATACAALGSPAAGELAGGLVQAATGGIRFLLSDIED